MLSKYVRKELEEYNANEIFKTIDNHLYCLNASKLTKKDNERFWKLFQDEETAELIYLICDAYREKGYNEF